MTRLTHLRWRKIIITALVICLRLLLFPPAPFEFAGILTIPRGELPDAALPG